MQLREFYFDLYYEITIVNTHIIEQKILMLAYNLSGECLFRNIILLFERVKKKKE